MKLLSILAAGVRGAENGTAELYRRGTSTRVTYYTSFEGDGAVSAGTDVDLDSLGRASVYVNELTRVVVKSSNGTTVLDVVEGDASTGVEVISSAFTGTDYETALSATSEPTTLKAVLDLWRTNASASDWKVSVGGSALTMYTALNRMVPFINVKDPTYGATGNGTTDDTTAITNALAAANSATGAIVFFPAGSYRITARLDVGAYVSIMGMGPAQSLLRIDHATNGTLRYNAAGGPLTLSGMGLVPLQANTGTIIEATVDVTLSIYDSVIGYSNANGTLVGSNGSNSAIYLTNCSLVMNGSTSKGAYASTGGRVIAVGCTFTTPATFNSKVVEVAKFVGVACIFECGATTAGIFDVVYPKGTQAYAIGRVEGCSFRASGGTSTMVCLSFDNAEASGTTKWSEGGNVLPNDTDVAPVWRAYYQNTVLAAYAGAQVQLGSRENRYVATGDTAAAVDTATGRYGVIIMVRTTNADFTINGSTAALVTGSTLRIVVFNSSGALRTITWGTYIVDGTGYTSTVANGVSRCFTFICNGATYTRTS